MTKDYKGHPLYSAISALNDGGYSRLHMPGHKGSLVGALAGIAPLDTTELPETDSLLAPMKAVKELESRFSALYDSKLTVLSVGGSTLCIQTMLALIPTGSRILCERGVHLSVINAMALLGLEPYWVYPKGGGQNGLPGKAGSGDFEAALSECGDAAAAFVTSIDYYGRMADIESIARVCHKSGIPLLCDNAHGAYLNFLDPSMHPLSKGADMVADSLHKTLPALTGTAALHVSKGSCLRTDDIRQRMGLFMSTSPSFILLLSCEELINTLEAPVFKVGLREAVKNALELRREARELGVLALFGDWQDPLRLTLPIYGVADEKEAGELARRHKIIPEMVSPQALVLMLAAMPDSTGFTRIKGLLREFPTAKAANELPPLPRPRAALGLREAALSRGRAVPIGEAVGAVSASVVAPCPPGVPVVMPGEIINKDSILLLESYGITEVNVLYL